MTFHIPTLSILAMSAGLISCGPVTHKPALDGRMISSLSFRDPGGQPIPDGRLRSLIQSRPGTPYAARRIDADVRRLFESGAVSDVHFDAKPDGDRVRLTAVVSELPSCGPAPFAGNTVFSDERLAQVTGLRTGSRGSRADFDKAASTIETLYHRSGHPNARVTVKPIKKGTSQHDEFVLMIDEGSPTTPKASVRSKIVP